MKKLYLALIAVTALIQFCKAQNTFPASGNVGIGTSNPIVPLQIHSNSNNNIVNEGLRIVNNYNSSGNNNPSIIFSNDGTAANPLSTTFQNWALSATVAGTAGFSILYKGGNNGLITPFYINGSGFVGIGTTNPDNTLSIVTNNNGGMNIKGNSSSYQGSDFFIGRTSSNPSVGYSPCIQFNDQATNAGALIQSYQGQFQFFTAPPGSGWNESMRISGNGNVGIGTTTPDQPLTVNGNIKSILGNPVLPAKNIVSIINLGYSGITGAQNWTIRGVYQYANGVGLNSDGGDLDIVKSLDGNVILATKTDGSSLGNVGIGTTNPGTYKLAVNGGIHSQSVQIDMNGWSDYVFKPTYKLKSLSYLKEYINQNHHLPEVPSEEDVIKKGVDIGEMNKLLLKKVEELTLYLIEKDKEVQAEKNARQKQQQKIDQLEEKLNTLINNLATK